MAKKETKNIEVMESSAYFDLGECTSLIAVQDKLLELAQAEKNILEEYKDSDYILQPNVYKETYNSVVGVFSDYRKILNVRKQRFLKLELDKEYAENLRLKIGKNARENISARFEIRLLKYQNKLYKREQAIIHKMDRKNAKNAHSAKISALIPHKTNGSKNLPP